MSSENEIKLQRLYYTSCKAYKNHFKEDVFGYNVLTASDKTATREDLKEILSFSSEPIKFSATKDYTFAFVWESASSIRGVFCASFPTNDDHGRASQFRNVLYGAPKGSLSLYECVEVYWDKERIRDVCDRQSVWSDDADEPNENKEPVLLETLKASLKEIEEQKREEFWNKLKNDANWKKTFSALLSAYFKRKNRESRIFLVASAEDVALAIWGLARLLPESALSDVSFAIRESCLYARRTIIGLDKELQKEEIAKLEEKIKDGFSDDAMIFEDGKTIGVALESKDLLSFLTDVEGLEEKEYWENIGCLNEFIKKYYEDGFSFSSLQLIEQHAVLTTFHYVRSENTRDITSVFKAINGQAGEHLFTFKKFVSDNFNDYWNLAKTDSEFALALWKVLSSDVGAAGKFFENFVETFFSCGVSSEERGAEFLFRLCSEESFADFISSRNNLERVRPLADLLFEKYVRDGKLTREIVGRKETKDAFLKVFQNIVATSQENAGNDLERLCLWFDNEKSFLEYVFENSASVLREEESKSFIKEKMLEFCFGHIEYVSKSPNKGFLRVLCSSEPFLLYLNEENLFDLSPDSVWKYLSYWNESLKKVNPKAVKSLTNWIEKVEKYRKERDEYEKVCDAFFEVIKLYEEVPELVKGKQQDIEKANKNAASIKEKLGLTPGKVFWEESLSRQNKLMQQLQKLTSEYPKEDNQHSANITPMLIDCYNIIVIGESKRLRITNGEPKRLRNEYDELMKVSLLPFLKRIDDNVKPQSSKEFERFKLGKEENRNNIKFLCELLSKNENIWHALGENKRKDLIRCRKYIGFSKKPGELHIELKAPPNGSNLDFKEWDERIISRLDSPTKSRDRCEHRTEIAYATVVSICVCVFVCLLWFLTATLHVKQSPESRPDEHRVQSPQKSKDEKSKYEKDGSMVDNYIVEGRKFLQKERFDDAIMQANIALNLDKSNTEAKQLIKEAEEAKAQKVKMEESKKTEADQDGGQDKSAPAQNQTLDKATLTYDKSQLFQKS